MSIASRHGKLTLRADGEDGWWRRREDLLTADVFGAFRYLPPELGLLPFLRGATNVEGLTLEAWAGVGCWRSIQRAELAFWPALEDRREPDLLIALRAREAANDLLVLVEAKLHAEQHWVEGRSQLGHYGRCLLEGKFDDELFDGPLPNRRPIVFLTKARESPRDELTFTREKELAEYVGDRTDVFWVSWHHAREVAASALAAQSEGDGPAHVLALLGDLLEDLGGHGFTAPRERLPWPLRLPAALDRSVEPWLRNAMGRRRRARALAPLELEPLARIDGPLHRWRMR